MSEDNLEILNEIKALYEEDEFHFEDDVVEEGDWVQEHKYQYCTTIIKYKDRFFAIDENRNGSYHSDWYYGDTTIREVERKEKVVTTITWEGLGNTSVEIPGKY